MRKALKILLVLYLIILLVLSFMPLTGYYAALGAIPVLGVYLYRKIILEQNDVNLLITRNIFLLACVVFFFGFVMNLFCTLYTTYRMVEFRNGIEEQKKKIYSEPGLMEGPSAPGTAK